MLCREDGSLTELIFKSFPKAIFRIGGWNTSEHSAGCRRSSLPSACRSRFKRGKVPRNNGITNKLLKIGGDVAAMHFVPLVLTCVLHQYEPLSWKGGTKGTFAVDDPQSYGSIFMSNSIGKIPFVPRESIDW